MSTFPQNGPLFINNLCDNEVALKKIAILGPNLSKKNGPHMGHTQNEKQIFCC